MPIYPGDTVVNAGTINVQAGGWLVLGVPGPVPLSFINSGTVTVSASGTIQVRNGQYTQIGGTTTVDGTLTGPTVVQGGMLPGSGTIGALTQTGGTVSPGVAAGSLTLGGNYSQTAGTLAVDLNGTAAGQFDQLKVTGTISLGGALAVTAGYAAAVGDTFTIIDNDGVDPVQGTFAGLADGASVTLGGKLFRVSYAGGTGRLRQPAAARPRAPAAPAGRRWLPPQMLRDATRVRPAGHIGHEMPV